MGRRSTPSTAATRGLPASARRPHIALGALHPSAAFRLARALPCPIDSFYPSPGLESDVADGKRALVVEGGGMKAAYANGVLSAFEEAGHTDWDAVYGTSAGGALAAWFAAGQARHAERTWDYAADRRILSYRRFLRRRGPLLDHDALYEIVYELEHPIDQAAIHRSPYPVFVTCSRLRDGHTTYHDLRDGYVIPWLKATGRLPFAAGDAVIIHGEAYLDGGITDPIPVRKAVEDGATDVTLIVNKPPGPYRRENAVLASVTARRYPALRERILDHAGIKHRAMQYAEAPPEGVTVRIIRPEQPTGLHRLTRDLDLIHKALEQGRSDGRRHLATVTGRSG